MNSSWMLRAAAAPERFLSRGFGRWLSQHGAKASVRPPPESDVPFPDELARFLSLVAGRHVGDFQPLDRTKKVVKKAKKRASGPSKAPRPFAKLLADARRSKVGRARLLALLAGALPFGRSPDGELWVYFVGAPSTPARGVVVALDPHALGTPRVVCRSAATFAVICTLHASADAGVDPKRANDLAESVAPIGVPEREAAEVAFDRARAVLDLLVGDDAAVRRAARQLARRPLDVPPPAEHGRRGKGGVRSASLALGPLVETYFRRTEEENRQAFDAHRSSSDRLVADAADALADTSTPLARELDRRRALANKSARRRAWPSATDQGERSRRLVALVDAWSAEGRLGTGAGREEALLALSEYGDASVIPTLLARAVTGDVNAVDMLAALGDSSVVPHLLGLLGREPQKYRTFESAVVKALSALGATKAARTLREMLEANPMPSWREGIERGPLVRELVAALGSLSDAAAGPALRAVLEATSQEYRAILPVAAWAVGKIQDPLALATLEGLLHSPKEPPTPEAIWAVGEIGAAHADVRERATHVVSTLVGLDAGAEVVRLTALSKMRAAAGEAVKTAELRRAIERALWEPGFRQEETSRRRTWAMGSLAELSLLRTRGGAKLDVNAAFLGHEAVRYLVTRDDHRVRSAAEAAFAAWDIHVPKVRRYYAFAVEELEKHGGLEALHEAVRDPLGIYRHNVATRLAEHRHPSSVRPLAEATARLFAEPPSSTYEYDDAPLPLVAFVRALARINEPEGNDVLIEGLRAGNHQVKAVVAENAPEDPRFVPELMAMLGDPRSFLRSRAERSLTSLGALPNGVVSPTRTVEM